MAASSILKTKKSLYKTGIMICVAMVFITFNVFVKGPAGTRKQVSLKQNTTSNQQILQNQNGRKILWKNDIPWLYDEYEDKECRDVHEINEMDEKCEFVENVDDCQNDEGFFDYTKFVYCDIGNEGGAMVILIIWWLFCFVGLAVCADDFFCPSLVVISKTLRLSNNVAGVTFLAFGNGAPDLFSAIAALESIEDGDSGLAVGGLFGAGMFVTTVVVGTIAVIKPFKAMERPFLRDAIFYLCGVYWTFFVLWKGKMYFAEAIGFILAYFMYVIVVVVSGSVYKKQRAREEAKNPKAVTQNGEQSGVTNDYAAEPIPETKIGKGDPNIAKNEMTSFGASFKPLSNDMPRSPTTLSIDALYNNQGFVPDDDASESNGKVADGDSAQSNGKPSMSAAQLAVLDDLDNIKTEIDVDHTYDEPEKFEDDEEVLVELTPIQELIGHLNPINTEEWSDMKVYEKGYEIFKSPIIFVITLTCPVVNYEDEEKHNWCRYLQCIQCILGPPICLSLIGVGTTKIDDVFPVWALSMLIGLCLAVLIFFTSKNEEKPKYHWAFGYAEFFIAIIWIYVIANEIVSLLETFGIVFNISDAILGLTLLAWGNSIGDWIANSLMARQGFARMGFAACFGAPFFNLMLGFGIPLLLKMIEDGTDYVEMQISGVQLILSVFLMGNMIAVMVILVAIKFKARRPLGIYLLCYYIAFLVTAVLAETGVVLEGWTPSASVKDALKDYYPD